MEAIEISSEIRRSESGGDPICEGISGVSLVPVDEVVAGLGDTETEEVEQRGRVEAAGWMRLWIDSGRS